MNSCAWAAAAPVWRNQMHDFPEVLRHDVLLIFDIVLALPDLFIHYHALIKIQCQIIKLIISYDVRSEQLPLDDILFYSDIKKYRYFLSFWKLSVNSLAVTVAALSSGGKT